MNTFILVAVTMTLVAAALVVAPLVLGPQRKHAISAVLAALAIPVAVVFLYLTVSRYSWTTTQGAVAGPGVPAEAGSMEAAVAGLEAKLRDNPQDEEGWLLLGSSYMNLGRPADALKAFERAVGLSKGTNLDARLSLAEAQVVLDPGALQGAAGMEIEAVIAAQPRNPKALWYGGLRALATGDANTARSRWSTLLQLSPPERVRQIIEAQLADLDGATPPTGSTSKSGGEIVAADATGRWIDARVSLSDGLQDKAAADAPVFVFVRDPARPGPPLAVIKRQVRDLPLTLRISDADVMLPGRSLENLTAAMLVARIANGGDPVARPGDIYGEAAWSQEKTGPVSILIDKVVSP